MYTEKVELTKIQVGQMIKMSGEFMESAELRLGRFQEDYMLNTLSIQMRAWITAQPMKVYTFTKPASLWDHFKLEWLPRLPRWIARRFTPGKEVSEIVEAGVLYPDLLLPNQRSVAYIRNL